MLNPQNTPNSSPVFVNVCQKIDRVITALHGTLKCQGVSTKTMHLFCHFTSYYLQTITGADNLDRGLAHWILMTQWRLYNSPKWARFPIGILLIEHSDVISAILKVEAQLLGGYIVAKIIFHRFGPHFIGANSAAIATIGRSATTILHTCVMPAQRTHIITRDGGQAHLTWYFCLIHTYSKTKKKIKSSLLPYFTADCFPYIIQHFQCSTPMFNSSTRRHVFTRSHMCMHMCMCTYAYTFMYI